jgi:hypothetical protein
MRLRKLFPQEVLINMKQSNKKKLKLFPQEVLINTKQSNEKLRHGNTETFQHETKPVFLILAALN